MGRAVLEFYKDVTKECTSDEFTNALGEPHKYKALKTLHEMESKESIHVVKCDNDSNTPIVQVILDGEISEDKLSEHLNDLEANDGTKIKYSVVDRDKKETKIEFDICE